MLELLVVTRAGAASLRGIAGGDECRLGRRPHLAHVGAQARCDDLPVDALALELACEPLSPAETGLVFTSETGAPLDPRNVLRAMTTAAGKVGLTGVTVHTLRHSAATAMLEAGIHLKAVSELLGHSDIRITGDVYGHVSTEIAKAAMDSLSGRLGI